MRKNYLLLSILAFTFSVGSTVSYASDDEYDDEDEEIIITLSGNNGASGKVTIEVEEYGVDSFKLKANDLNPNTRYLFS